METDKPGKKPASGYPESREPKVALALTRQELQTLWLELKAPYEGDSPAYCSLYTKIRMTWDWVQNGGLDERRV